jgi:Fe-S-cluster-containing dehydrogenase component
MEKIDSGIAKGLKPGKDRDATPTCVNTCPTTARHFGDLDDLNSEVSRLIRKYCGERFHPEFGTDPSTWYIRG